MLDTPENKFGTEKLKGKMHQIFHTSEYMISFKIFQLEIFKFSQFIIVRNGDGGSVVLT